MGRPVLLYLFQSMIDLKMMIATVLLVKVSTKLRIASLHAAWLRVTPVQLKIGYNCDNRVVGGVQ